jgi:hypothetical protein
MWHWAHRELARHGEPAISTTSPRMSTGLSPVLTLRPGRSRVMREGRRAWLSLNFNTAGILLAASE